MREQYLYKYFKGDPLCRVRVPAVSGGDLAEDRTGLEAAAGLDSTPHYTQLSTPHLISATKPPAGETLRV